MDSTEVPTIEAFRALAARAREAQERFEAEWSDLRELVERSDSVMEEFRRRIAALEQAQPTPVAPVSLPARQLGFYRPNFPWDWDKGFTAQQKLLAGSNPAEVNVACWFIDGRSWESIASGGGALYRASRWSAGSDRRHVIGVPMCPPHSGTAKGTDAHVADMLRRIAAGEFDAHFASLGRQLATHGFNGPDTLLRVGWEMNGDFYPWRAGADMVAWVQAYRRIVGRIRSTAPNVRFVWGGFGITGVRNGAGHVVGKFEDIYPGDEYVDVVGVDIYDGPTRESWLIIETVLNRWQSFAANQGKPFCVPEWGCRSSKWTSGDMDNPFFVENMHRWVEDPGHGVDFHCYFDTRTGDGDSLLSAGTVFPRAAARFAELPWRTTRT